MGGFVGRMAARGIGILRSGGSRALNRRRPLGAVLFASAAWGCVHAETVTGSAPRLTPTADTLGVRVTINRVSSVPIAAASRSLPQSVTIRFGPHVDAIRPPALFIVDGEVMGRRADGSIDHGEAERRLRTLDPHRIESIEIVKGADAVRRFGPSARDGTVLIFTTRDRFRAPTRTP